MSTLRYLAQSLIKEIIETDCPTISGSANVSKLISLFYLSENYEAMVTNGNTSKLVTVRDVLKVTDPVRTSVSRIAFTPPSITPATAIYEASLKLIHSKVRILPVLQDESTIGVIRQTKILDKMGDCEDLEECTSEELMVENPVTVTRDSSAGVVRSTMLKTGISHTPVVDNAGKLRGMITAKDLIWTFIKPGESQTVGERKGEATRIWEMGIKGLIDQQPLHVTRRTCILDVIHEMSSLKKGYCLVVEKQRPIGIITPRDIISLLTQYEPKAQIPVYVVGLKDSDEDLVQSARRNIERVAVRGLKFHPDLQEIVVDGRIKSKTSEKNRFEVKARAFMATGMIAVTAEGWSLRTVFDEVGEKLDARLRQIKGRRKSNRPAKG